MKSNANLRMVFTIKKPATIDAVKRAAGEYDFKRAETDPLMAKGSEFRRNECNEIKSEIKSLMVPILFR
jgi:hypothetical protein